MKNTLHIDTSNAGRITVVLTTSEGKFSKESEQKFGSQALLGLIDEILKEQNLVLKNLSEIKVATGPGSYTGLRVGVAVANALGFSLQIPVNSKKIETDLSY